VNAKKMTEVVACASAEQLIDEMSVARGRLWTSARESMFLEHDWIFRGTAQAHWPLRPAAFREDAFAQLMPAQRKWPLATSEAQRSEEHYWVSKFCAEADRMRQSIPGERPELRDPRFAIGRFDPHQFPPLNRLHLYAVAQHHGVPTRLLDWTTSARVAAYFAVERLAKVRASLLDDPAIDAEKPCAVWAINGSFVHNVAAGREFDPAIFVVTAPKTAGASLAAQGGIFTLVQPRSGDPHPIPDLDEVLRENASRVPRGWEEWAPFLYKFTLPAHEARVALRMLAAEGIHAGSIRPGLVGVVEALREQKAYQWAEKGDRT
jgi:FRG domain